MGNKPQQNAKKTPCIIYFHEGFSPYLPFALRQARISNPDARIILLGDSENRIKGIPYEHHLLSDFKSRHQEFLECYRHFHPGHLGDERRCIERWIYLSEFLKKQQIEEFLFLDRSEEPRFDSGSLARGGRLLLWLARSSHAMLSFVTAR